MKKTLGLATFLVIAAGASGAGALDLKGSDTLESFTKNILANCPGTSTLVYLGGGSGSGENAMVAGSQQVAPMSRGLGVNACGATGGASKGAGIVAALDGLSVIGATTTAGTCGTAGSGSAGLKFSGSIPVTDQNGVAGIQPSGVSSTYTLADWKDALKVLFAGVHNNGAKDCNSDVRHSLANTWGNVFQSACTSGACTKIQHLLRRDDLSGTTDTFLSLLGLPGIATKPFCNGDDFSDNDPIRRPCNDAEQVCRADGTLGLLLPVFVPESNIPDSVIYNTKPCADGVFTYEPATFDAPEKCPNGAASVLGFCLTPRDGVVAPGFPKGKAGCVFSGDPFTNALPFGWKDNQDGRALNLWTRNPDGTIAQDANGRELVGSFYRIHATTKFAAGNHVCKEASATLQIGCLAQASPCSLGFAGKEGGDSVTGALSLDVSGITPTVANIRKLLSNDPTRYPMARKLYINSIKGFENVTGAEKTLAACFADQTKADTAATASGFVTLGVKPACEDFNETACSGVTTNNNACSAYPF